VPSRLSIFSFRRIPHTFSIAVILAVITTIVLLVPKPIDYKRYIAANIDKLQLIEKTESPKIVFVGGSAGAFGLDSRMIQKKLNRPVVNMGLAAGLGLPIMFEELKPYIGRKDIIVIIPEYELLCSGLNGEGSVLLEAYLLIPEIRRYIKSPKTYLSMLKGIPGLVNRRGRWYIVLLAHKGYLHPIYNRYVFNEYGDFDNYEEVASMDIGILEMAQRSIDSSFNVEALDELQNFISYAKGRGSRVAIVHPPTLAAFYEKNKKDITSIDERLRRGLEGYVLGRPEDTGYPAEYFFNTEYHLNRKGRSDYTKYIISILRSAFFRD
jgi:hypothetical protein